MDIYLLVIISLMAIAITNYSFARKIFYLLPVAFIFSFLEIGTLEIGYFDLDNFLIMASVIIFVTSIHHPVYYARQILKKTIRKGEGPLAIRQCLINEYFLPLFLGTAVFLWALIYAFLTEGNLKPFLMIAVILAFVIYKSIRGTIRLSKRLSVRSGP